MKSKITAKLNDIMHGMSKITFIERPCKVINVRSQYVVDVEYYSNNKANTILNVPVKYLQSSKAYVFLGLSVGDRGTVRFLDNDVKEYFENTGLESSEIRSHNINDNLFSIGFYPLPEQYIFPKGDIVIGTNSGGVINITEDSINISGGNVFINAANVSLGSNTVIDGKKFLEHSHSNGNQGSPTGGVI